MKKALVIEDNEDNLRLITYVLQRGGYGVVPARSGEEGIGLALREKPSFIIVDIGLPGIDGIETTKRIRESPESEGIPIIAITSSAMLGDREKVLAAGCADYFEKPIDPLTIMDRIHAILGRERK